MRKKFILRSLIMIASVAVVLLLVKQTQAWLLDQTAVRENQFTVAKINHEIEEEFNGALKTNVRVTNTGNTKSFIRVLVLPQWLDKNTSTPVGLVAEETYQISFNQANWTKKGDYWYYNQPVEAGAQTDVLIKSAAPKEGLSESYRDKVFNLQVITQSVQATPIEAVKDLWGFDPSAS